MTQIQRIDIPDLLLVSNRRTLEVIWNQPDDLSYFGEHDNSVVKPTIPIVSEEGTDNSQKMET